jgi:hypothetical protein
MGHNTIGYGKPPFYLRRSLNAILVTRYFTQRTTPSVSFANSGTASANAPNPFLLPPQQTHPAWPIGQKVSMHVHLSTSAIGDVFSGKWTSGWRDDQDADLPSFVWDNMTLGDWSDERVARYDVILPEVSEMTISDASYGCWIPYLLERTAKWIIMGRYFSCEKWFKP